MRKSYLTPEQIIEINLNVILKGDTKGLIKTLINRDFPSLMRSAHDSIEIGRLIRELAEPLELNYSGIYQAEINEIFDAINELGLIRFEELNNGKAESDLV